MRTVQAVSIGGRMANGSPPHFQLARPMIRRPTPSVAMLIVNSDTAPRRRVTKNSIATDTSAAAATASSAAGRYGTPPFVSSKTK